MPITSPTSNANVLAKGEDCGLAVPPGKRLLRSAQRCNAIAEPQTLVFAGSAGMPRRVTWRILACSHSEKDDDFVII